MRFFTVTVGSDGDTRTLRVPSPTAVQASDAAAPLMRPGEAVLAIVESPDDGLQQTDSGPPKSQAEELAPVTPGAAAVSPGNKA